MGRTRCSATATLMAILWRQKTTATATTSAGGVVLPFLYLLVLVYTAGSKLESSTCESITFGIKSKELNCYPIVLGYSIFYTKNKKSKFFGFFHKLLFYSFQEDGSIRTCVARLKSSTLMTP